MSGSSESVSHRPYLTSLGAFALAFGCSVGWGAFVMPGTTFLPLAGPVGTSVGIFLGALVMLIIAANYHYLIGIYPDGGGAYTYTKQCFGYDHGFLSAWFLILTYIAIIWANGTALPLIARTLLGSFFQFGFHYRIAGFDIYMGEILLVLASFFIGMFVCLRRSLAMHTQIVMAFLLLFGAAVCFAAGMTKGGGGIMKPDFAPDHSAFGGTFTIFALAPWAFVGFESISHSALEARFPLKRAFRIMAIALLAAGAAYIFLSLLAVTAAPDGAASWTDYILHLGDYSGLAAQPAFFAANAALGSAGSALLGFAAVGAIFTGIIGNTIALSRLLCNMAEDGLLGKTFGKIDRHGVPKNAVFLIFAMSFILPFFGRTAISWIVDVTTVGATIAFAFASAAAFKTAKQRKDSLYAVTGVVGLIVSLLFALEFLIPNITSVKTLSTESYLILAAWGILGFIAFRLLLRNDKQRRFGRSTVAWIVLLGLIIFTSTVWMRQATSAAIEKTVAPIQTYYTGKLQEAGVDIVSGATRSNYAYLHEMLDRVDSSLSTSTLIQIVLIIVSLIILFSIYAFIQRREKQIEVEKALAEESSRAKTSFLSNMSHEIRTPMNAIIGLDNIALRDPALTPRTREQLEKIGISAKHLLGLINDILDMSRIESGRMVLKNEEFPLREFIDQINVIINGQCQDKGLNYDCRLVGHLDDYYVGDSMKLKQVLINILGNSVKFTEAPGDVTLTVEQIASEEKIVKLRFTMKDTGIGMDKEFLPKIFEAFSQEDATTTNRYGGSGLGMAITKNFVEMMNGTIHVDSEKGVGTVFTVTVSLGASDRTFAAEQSAALPEHLRVLIVDDDAVALEHALILLNQLNVRDVSTASSGKEGLAMLQKAFQDGAPYELLITDYRMPDLNGLGLIRALHGFDGGRTAVILLTGYNWNIIEDEAHAEGVTAIMAKPLFSDNLLHMMHTVLSDGSEAEEPAAEESKESTLAGRRILMAEDVDANAEILADLLDLEGVESDRAENGSIAVEKFAASPQGAYDAILMDVRMPVMDGLTATEKIRALDRPDAKTIPIIAMTANVFDEDVERSLAAGMNAHLSKPIEPERLYTALERFIGRDAE